MKKIVIVLAIIFTLFSCSENEQNIETENSIYGTWQLFERYNGLSLLPFTAIENGEIKTFSSENKYKSSFHDKEGKFFIKGSIIEVSIPELTQDTIKFVFSLKDNILNLSSFPSSCDEGCYDSYRRITDDE
jgi:hypothetical protein